MRLWGSRNDSSGVVPQGGSKAQRRSHPADPVRGGACAAHGLLLQTPFHQYAHTSLAKVVLFLVTPLVFFRLTQGSFKEMFAKPDRHGITISVILAGAVFAVIWGVFVMVRPYLNETMIVDALAKNGITSSNFVIVFVYDGFQRGCSLRSA